METDSYLTQYFEIQDGEYFCIQNVDDEFSEPSDQILMDRKMAIEMAYDILRMFNGSQF